jgi:uncharacterized protein YegP (UPF0339 family)
MMDTMQHDELAEIDLTEDEIDAMMADGDPVEVSGPFDPVRRVRFELVGGGANAYRWRIVAANGEILAISAAAYGSPNDVRRVVTTLAAALRDAPLMEADDVDQADHHQAS